MPISGEMVQAVWEKGQRVSGANPDRWRKDHCAAWIQRNKYGVRDTDLGYGWEIDHIKPASEGGTEALSSLRPLQWKNNAARQSGRLTCVVTSSGSWNVYK